MKQFIAIVLRNQFNLFYRFGYTFIPDTFLIEFDGNISDNVKEKVVELFCRITPFEYDEEYLILHFEKEQIQAANSEFNIQDLVAIYPISQQAKVSIESKIDSRIRLENPIFEDILPKIELEIETKEIEKVIDALWTICKIDGKSDDYLSKIGMEHIFKGLEARKSGIKANKIQKGNYWEYLIAYDRYDYFPNTTLGYFYDAGQVFAYSKGKTNFEGSSLHGFLEKLNKETPEIEIEDILKSFDDEETVKSYISQATISDIKQYIIAPLYLLLRDDIINANDIKQTKLFESKDDLIRKFSDNFKYAVILLSTFFGFRRFYDAYYDSLNLKFYKSQQNKQKEKPETTNTPDSEIATKQVKNETLDPKIDSPDKKQPDTAQTDSEEMQIRQRLKNNKIKHEVEDKIIEIWNSNHRAINDKLFSSIKINTRVHKSTIEKIRNCFQSDKNQIAQSILPFDM